jgi:hypothetical protein
MLPIEHSEGREEMLHDRSHRIEETLKNEIKISGASYFSRIGKSTIINPLRLDFYD